MLAANYRSVLVPWALTMFQIMHNSSGWSQRTIVKAMVTQSWSLLASTPVSHFTKTRHDQANIDGHPLYNYVWWTCMDANALWRAEVAWAFTIHDCKDLAWALTREWVLSQDTVVNNILVGMIDSMLFAFNMHSKLLKHCI